jgi:hypothetical protein
LLGSFTGVISAGAYVYICIGISSSDGGTLFILAIIFLVVHFFGFTNNKDLDLLKFRDFKYVVSYINM